MTILDLLGEPEWSIILPMPPSTNQLSIPVATRGRSRFVTSPIYRDWKLQTAFLPWPESSFLSRKFIGVEIRTGPDFNNAGDCDNLIKPVIDALVNNGALIDDSRKYVCAALGWWGPSHPIGKGVVRACVYPEKVFNGVEDPKELFDFDAVQ